MQRVKSSWSLDRSAKLWIAKIARAQMWRVLTPSYDLDDLIQDGYMKWYHVVDKYPDVNNRRHIMGLFQVAFLNHIQMKATQRTKQASLNLTFDEITMSEIMRDEELATMQVLCAQAPEQIQKVLKLLSSENGCKKLRSLHRRHSKSRKNPNHTIRETFNEKLCRLCGIEAGTDIAGLISSHFGEPKIRRV